MVHTLCCSVGATPLDGTEASIGIETVQSPTVATIKPGLLINCVHFSGQRSFLVVTVSRLAGLIQSAIRSNPMNTLVSNQNKYMSRVGMKEFSAKW